MDRYDSYTSNEQAVASLLLVWGIALAVVGAIIVVNYLLVAIPLAAVFRKTGIESWKAWVPFYSTYTWLRLGGQNGHWVWASFVPPGGIVTSVFLYLGMHRTGIAFGRSSVFVVLGILLPWVWLCVLAFGRGEYRPERLVAAGLGAPLEGDGAQTYAAAGAMHATPYAPPAAGQAPPTA
jgi:hypothetical protein